MLPQDALENISGTVAAVIFTNEENGYTVLRMEGEDGPFTAVGCIPYAAPGENYDMVGSWGVHSTHGKQFNVTSFERWLPEQPSQIAAFLASGMFRGIGLATARRIVEHFGTEVFDTLRDNPEAFCQVRGITQEHALEMGRTFSKYYDLRTLMEFTSQLGLPSEVALRLHTRYGEDALSLIMDNPYLLIDGYFGIRFSEVDRFALRMGVPLNSSMRFEAALRATLLKNLENGHVFLPREKLQNAVGQLLNISDSEFFTEPLNQMIERHEVYSEEIFQFEACYLAEMYEGEVEVAEKLLMLSHPCGTYRAGDAEPLISSTEKRLNIQYAPLQREAILCAAENGLMILTGGPGTGKTTTIRGILSLYDQMGLSVVLAAPTGRAAKRMTALTGEPAKTIHRLLEASYTADRNGSVFARNEENPIEADVVVVDEVSMIDLPLMRALLNALSPSTRLILVGDADQLASVGPGNVLGDMAASGVLPTIQLTEIFRQSQQSAIITNAHAVNRGVMPQLKSLGDNSDFYFMRRTSPDELIRLIVDLCSRRLPGYRGLTVDDIQVIAPTKVHECGTVALNQALQSVLNPSRGGPEIRTANYSLRVGDRVMQTVNDYDLCWERDDGSEAGQGVFNGDIGKILTIDPQSGTMTVHYDDRVAVYQTEQVENLDLAYAITVHKAQGSEFPCVIFAALDNSERLLTRNLLYTALTRARSLLVVVGAPEVLSYMVENIRSQRRYTSLKLRLRRMNAQINGEDV